MIVNETAKDGKTIERTTIDVGKNTVTIEREQGRGLVVVETRPLTKDETDLYSVVENSSTLEDRIRTSLTRNKQFLDIAQPTAAQVAAQVRSLTQQLSALIRRDIQDFSGVD